MSSPSPPPDEPRWWTAPEFVRSLPLFVFSAGFFVAGGILRFAYPSYALYGPGVFTFWALLLALGFTCAIGGVVSWTLAGDVPVGPTDAPTRAPAPAYLPIDFPEEHETATPVVPPTPSRSREDFGRPAPAIRGTVASGEWYEGPTDSERFSGPDYMLPVDLPAQSETEDEDPAEYEPVEKVLADLERIERELAPRARITEPSAP